MEKLIFDLIQLVILARVSYIVLRWTFSPKIRRKSIVGKLWRLISRHIHYKLDNALKKQSLQSANGKVIPLRKTK